MTKQSEHKGKVILVGAGPGAPDLITIRAMRYLQQADVVLYDRLTHPDLLSHTSTHTRCIYVGKHPDRPGAERQQNIHDLLVQHAREGSLVVRLKGGDPFVFGRGGEEIEALQRDGIAYEIVPGLTSALAVPTSVGIPLTHRDFGSSFAVFTGRSAAENQLDSTHWELAAKIPTAIFLMGVRNLQTILSKLIEHGRSPDTPVAIIERGTYPSEQLTKGTIASFRNTPPKVASPAVIMLGEIVSLADQKELAHFANEQVSNLNLNNNPPTQPFHSSSDQSR